MYAIRVVRRFVARVREYAAVIQRPVSTSNAAFVGAFVSVRAKVALRPIHETARYKSVAR